MANECQESTDVYEDLTDIVHNNCEQSIGLVSFSYKLKTEKNPFSPTTSQFDSRKGGKTPSSLKHLPLDDSIPNVRQSITDLPPALITEVLNCLDPKDLGIVSCVSKVLNNVASEHHAWKEFYCERWGLPAVPSLSASKFSNEKSWKELFMEREFRSKIFMGRYSIDVLYGHTEAVRTVFVLSSAKLIFTSGYDSIVRMWDLEEGLSIASSRPLGCTIRALAADIKLLVAGGTDGFIHCWRAIEGFPHLFDIKGLENHNAEFRLWEHEGPITSLALDHTRIYSGSWDMSVRVWDRFSLKCLKVLRHNDWVWALVPHNSTVASTSGSDIYVWDIDSGDPIIIIQNVHVGNTCSLARSCSGEFIFTGGEDGAIHMYEVTNHSLENNVLHVATWIPHSGAVHSLAFEFPWLVSSSNDGKMSLIDVRKLLKTRKGSSQRRVTRVQHFDAGKVEPPQRMLHVVGGDLFSVDIGDDRIVCAGEEGVVRIWNFSQALEIEQKARALRGLRLENRARRRMLQAEISGEGSRNDRCVVAATKKSPLNKRGMSSKLKA